VTGRARHLDEALTEVERGRVVENDADEDRMTAARDELERRRRECRGDIERRVRLLQRRWDEIDVVKVIELTPVAVIGRRP